MANPYERFAQAASKLLSGPLGAPAILRRSAGGGYDDNGEPVPVTFSEMRVRAVVIEREVWNAGAYLGRKTVATVVSKVKPQPQDQLLIGADTYAVSKIDTIAPDGKTVIRYELLVA